MEKHKNYLFKTTQFMIVFKKYLASKNLSTPQQLFTTTHFNNSGWISKYQFLKLVQSSNTVIQFEPIDIIEIYKQIADGWQQMSMKSFIEAYHSITSNIPHLPPLNAKEAEAKRKQQEKQKKNRIIRMGLKKLQTYVAQNNPIQLFEQCDEDCSGKLDPNEFNKLLIRTAIKQFQDKMVRKIIVKQIFSYFPSKQMKLEEYIKFFKISKQKLQKKPENMQTNPFYIPPQLVLPFSNKNDLKRPHTNSNRQANNVTFNQPTQPSININIKAPTMNVKPAQNKNVTLKQNNFKKKKMQQPAEIHPLKKNQSEQSKNQIVQANKIFPNASVYYRNGIPQIDDLSYFQQLQILIQKDKKFKDNSNPITNKGKYYEATTFFNGSSYKLFEMAQSVIQRQKSRIGLAREIQPKDIIQGQVGDCYFLSSIASLISIYPEVISQKFLFNQNPAGYYVVKIFLDGKWNFMVTDDYFPSQNGNTALYARPHGREIWVMLLEKCWAKCFGNFKDISSGSPKQAFMALTGAPTQYFSLKSKQMTQQTIQNKIKQAYKLRYVVTASGSDYLDSLPQKQQQRIGLVGSHAYSFLKFIDINGIHLVKIRNPWGTRIWKGQWSFQSNKWTKQMRDKLNYNKNPQDGSFYMSMKDFLNYFGSFVICKVNPTYTHTSLQMNFKNHKSNYVRMKVSQSGRYLLSLYQQNQRKMATTYNNFKHSPARIIVMKCSPEWEYIDSYQNSQSYAVSVEVDLQEGCEYIISSKYQWRFKSWQDSHEGCLTSYGPQKVSFQLINRQIAPIFKSQMIQSFFNKNRGKTKDYNKIGANGAYSEYLFSIQKGIGYYFITNPSKKKFELTHSIQGQGIKVIKPNKLPFKFDMSPDSRYLRGFFTSSQGFNYQSSESMTYY